MARSRAEALAAAAGLTLGAPRRIEEDADGSPAPFRGSVAMFRAAAESAPTEVTEGEIEISARVRAWFDVA